MQINDEKRKVIFLVVYTILATLLIINAVKSRMLIDIFYTLIFMIIYVRNVYIKILG